MVFYKRLNSMNSNAFRDAGGKSEKSREGRGGRDAEKAEEGV